MNPNRRLFLRSAVSGIPAVALGRGRWAGQEPGGADPQASWADTTSNTYYHCLICQTYLFAAAGTVTEQFLAAFEDVPPRQRAAWFTIDQAVEKLMQGLGGK